MKVKIKDILLLFKKMYCDELKEMTPDTGASLDIGQNQKCRFTVTYTRMKKQLTCTAEMLVDSDNQLVHVTFTPTVQQIEFDYLVLPGIQCTDDLERLHKDISISLSHPELNQEFKLTFTELELLYKLFIGDKHDN